MKYYHTPSLCRTLEVLWLDRNQTPFNQDDNPFDDEDDSQQVYYAIIRPTSRKRFVPVKDTVIWFMHREQGWTGILNKDHPQADVAVQFAKLVFGETLESIRCTG
jgi:hypothetical protein